MVRSTSLPRIATSCAPSLLFLVVYVGDTWRVPSITTPLFFLLLLVSIRLRGVDFNQTAWVRASGVMAGILLAILLSSRPYQGMVIYHDWGWPLRIAGLVAVSLVGITIATRVRAPIALTMLAAAGLAVRACGLLQSDVDPEVRDMLPVIVSALDRFVAGENPYGVHAMQVGSEILLSYPPGLWLTFLPAHIVGLDLRWTTWAADAVVVSTIGTAAWRRDSRGFGPVLMALTIYLFLPDVHWNGIYAEPQVDWAVQAALSASVLSRRPFLASAALAVALTVRPFNLLLVPIFAIWIWRIYGGRTALRAILLAGSIAGGIYLPFVVRDPGAFFAGTIRWLLAYGPAHRSWFHDMMGFTGRFYDSNLETWLAPIQFVCVLLLCLLAWFRLNRDRDFLVFAALLLACFIGFNSMIWMSFWIGPILFLVAGLSCADQDAEPRLAASQRKWYRAGEIVGAAAVVGMLAVHVGLLVHHFDESGRNALRQELSERLRPGDRVLDRTGWRVASLQMPHLFESGELPEGVLLLQDPFSAAETSPFQTRQVWVTERFGLFTGVSAIYLGADETDGPYSVVELRSFGRFRLIRLTRRSGPPQPLFEGEEWNVSPRTARHQPCEHRGTSRSMIAVSPGSRSLIGKAALDETRWVFVYAGWSDAVAHWRTPKARIVLRLDGVSFGEIEVRNSPGLSGQSFRLPRAAGSLVVEVLKPPETRGLCLDVVGLP